MVYYNMSISLLLLLLSIDLVLSYPHLKQSTPDVNAHELRNLDTTLPLQKTFNEIYKRKHNLDEKLNLHPTRKDLLNSLNSHTVDNFQVFYPENKQKMNEQKQEDKKKVKEQKVEEKRLPLLLSSIGAGLDSEANASLELFPGSLTEYVKSTTTYFKKVYSNFKKKLHQFFDAIDEHLKKSNSTQILDLGDVMF